MIIDSFKGKYSFLSNFATCYFIVFDEVRYRSVEHAYQAAKTLNLGERLDIYLANTPGQAKRLGKKVHVRLDWDEVKLSIMEDLLRQKFVGSDVFRQLLIKTSPAELIEGNNWNDTYWGVCNGVGENHLGKLLMKIRGELI